MKLLNYLKIPFFDKTYSMEKLLSARAAYIALLNTLFVYVLVCILFILTLSSSFISVKIADNLPDVDFVGGHDSESHFYDRQHMAGTPAMEIIQSYPFLKSFLAGSLSGTCSTLLFQPLDLIKTRIQNASKSGPRSGMISLFLQVLRNEKLLGLWKGTVPSIMRCVPGVGMYFSSLHWLQVNFGSSNPPAVESFCFGVLARSFAGTTLLPVTVIKTRYESGVYSYSSLSEALVKIYKNEGRKGLFSGLAPTLFRDAPFSGIYLMFYYRAKQLVPISVREHVSPAPVNFGCGVVSGVLASAITQPADVIKTKMQLYPQKYFSVPVSITLVFKENGITGFFSGMVPRVMRRTLMASMAWTVYEQIIHYAGLK